MRIASIHCWGNLGNRVSSAGQDRSVKRPALNTFWEELKEQITSAKTFNEIVFPEYESAWNEWKSQLKYIDWK